mgnify:CR=1 FL=1
MKKKSFVVKIFVLMSLLYTSEGLIEYKIVSKKEKVIHPLNKAQLTASSLNHLQFAKLVLIVETEF